MSGPRLFIPQPLSAGMEFDLPADACNHLRVLRVQAGQPLVLFDGHGGEYAAELLLLERRQARVRIEAHAPREAESPLNITLIQGISKGERMDFTIQKSVELGVSAILPVFSERSVVQLNDDRLQKRRQHWQNVAIAACEQCGRNTIPEILPPQVLRQAWPTLPKAQQYLVLDPNGERRLRELPAASTLSLLAGPEGGLTEAEIAAAAEHGFMRLSLGPRILRTETAGLAAIAGLQALHGDL